MKKWILTLLAVICVVCSALGLAACVPDGLESHNWSKDWRHTIDEHWRYCLDEGCSKTSENAYHDLEVIEVYEGREPTCGKLGRGLLRCRDCGVIIEDAVPATGEHNWKDAVTVIETTCNKDGVAFAECEECGQIKKVVIPATGDHRYSDDNWRSDAQGHQQVCADCKTSSGFMPHEAGDPVTTPIVGMNDGKVETFCKICGYLISSEILPNLEVPVSLSINIEGVDIRRINDKSGQVTLTVGQAYTVSYSAVNGNGQAMNDLNEIVMSGANVGGVRVYYLTNKNNEVLISAGVDYNVDGANNIASTYDPTTNVSQIRVNTSGMHRIIFWYETGDGVNHKQRASYTLYINYDIDL